MKLSEEHISAAYWLAERYRTVTVKELVKLKQDINQKYGDCKLSLKHLINTYTRPGSIEDSCVLCMSTEFNENDCVWNCNCIHRHINNNVCTSQDSYKCFYQVETMLQAVRAMHKRAVFLYDLLTKYNEQE